MGGWFVEQLPEFRNDFCFLFSFIPPLLPSPAKNHNRSINIRFPLFEKNTANRVAIGNAPFAFVAVVTTEYSSSPPPPPLLAPYFDGSFHCNRHDDRNVVADTHVVALVVGVAAVDNNDAVVVVAADIDDDDDDAVVVAVVWNHSYPHYKYSLTTWTHCLLLHLSRAGCTMRM